MKAIILLNIKRYTTTGMATDQGKTSNINALGILSEALGNEILWRCNHLPHALYTYIYGRNCGRDIKGLFDPIRTTRIDSWHHAHGAKFEHVGQWMRAWYYPQDGRILKQL